MAGDLFHIVEQIVTSVVGGTLREWALANTSCRGQAATTRFSIVDFDCRAVVAELYR